MIYLILRSDLHICNIFIHILKYNYRKDARLPVQLQRAMAAEAEAAREARAKVIAAEGEQKASRALKEASEIIAESSSALQLRYLQVHYQIIINHVPGLGSKIMLCIA